MTERDDGSGDAEFAERVLAVLEKIQAREPSPEQDRDVRRTAIGLYFLANAANHFSRIASSVLASGETGANEALALLAAIKAGEDNPIWKYLRGIRENPKRAAKADGIHNQRRYIMIGCVRAYHSASKCSKAEAYRVIARECSLPDVAFNGDRIKDWLKRYNEDHAKVETHLKAIAAYADAVNRVAGAGDPDKPLTAERVLEAARKLVGQAWGVPYVE
jgi:hypothetical protein